MLIRDLLKLKSNEPILVSPDDDIRESAALMVEQSVSALIVVTKEGSLAGILTERDVARYFADDAGHDTTKVAATVSSAMTSDVITCTSDHRVSEIAQIMSDSNIRNLPVQ
jgi:CBS domain-containing protein